MSQILKKHWPVILILVVSLVTHFALYGHPNETVFDEVHFGKFISGYFTHEYFFDIHPPLGKLIISGAGYLTGFKPGFSFAQIGEKFPDNNYLWLRLLPTLAGVLLPLVLYFLALRLGLSRMASTTLGLLMALENSFIVQSRFILLDSFLLLFGFSALYSYLTWRAGPPVQAGKINPDDKVSGPRLKRRGWWILATGIFAGMAVSIKWTGLSFLGIILILELFHLWHDGWGSPSPGGLGHFTRLRSFERHHAVFLCLIVAPAVIYISSFVVHLELLSKSGPGDAFMTSEFRKTLTDSTDSTNSAVQPLNMWQKIIELNREMYISNATLTATHPYASKWYTWPFMQRPIYYWHRSDTRIIQPGQNIAPEDSRIYFLGNPVIWFLSTMAILYLILDQLGGLYWRKKIDFLPRLIIGGYVLNMLPFIGITRAMFLYHYMIGYVFAMLALVYLIDKIPDRKNPTRGWSVLGRKKTICIVVIVVGIANFLYFAPLTYGTPLTEKAYSLCVWLPSWR